MNMKLKMAALPLLLALMAFVMLNDIVRIVKGG